MLQAHMQSWLWHLVGGSLRCSVQSRLLCLLTLLSLLVLSLLTLLLPQTATSAGADKAQEQHHCRNDYRQHDDNLAPVSAVPPRPSSPKPS